MSKKVSLVKGSHRSENITKALQLIKSDLHEIKGKKNILIKPNLTATKNSYANTHVEAVETALNFLMDNFPELKDSQFTIYEGSGSAHYENSTTREVFENFGYFELIKKYNNVKIKCIEEFEKLEEFEELSINSFASTESIKIVKQFFDFDYRISIGIPKSHNYAIATFGIKNMVGVIKQDDKSMIHGLCARGAPDVKTVFSYVPVSTISYLRRRAPNLVNFVFKNSVSYLKAIKVIHRNIVKLARLTWPDLVILDGFYCMDGNGPVDGTPVKLEIAVSSTDPLKADGVGARILGLSPDKIGYLYYLNEEGLGDYSLAGLVGHDIEQCKQYFKLHPTYKIQKNWQDSDI